MATRRVLLGTVLLDRRRYARAAEHLRVALATLVGPSALLGRAANSLAWADLMQGDAALLPEADRWSAKAIELLPDEPAVQGTRGTVLLGLGRLDEGIALLERSEQGTTEQGTKRPQARALDLAALALGEALRGDSGRARALLAKVHALDPRCELLPRAEAALAHGASLHLATSPPAPPPPTAP